MCNNAITRYVHQCLLRWDLSYLWIRSLPTSMDVVRFLAHIGVFVSLEMHTVLAHIIRYGLHLFGNHVQHFLEFEVAGFWIQLCLEK